MIDNMPEKTGKSLVEWKKVMQAKKFAKHTKAVKYLKNEYGVTHGFANTIVILSKEENIAPNDLVAEQYKGKEILKPIFDRLITLVKGFGSDVVVTPKKATVSLIRKKQFALIKPASKTRIDLGLKLVGKALTPRLGNSGAFGTMCTHCVKLTSVSEVDEVLKSWLLEAYEKAE